jgi:hypothetical protein
MHFIIDVVKYNLILWGGCPAMEPGFQSRGPVFLMRGRLAAPGSTRPPGSLLDPWHNQRHDQLKSIAFKVDEEDPWRKFSTNVNGRATQLAQKELQNAQDSKWGQGTPHAAVRGLPGVPADRPVALFRRVIKIN